ncbi:hypothetical protein AVEN_223550-1 [Araneus ventricosus]|uniref:DNA-directed DNA polymerase n=1 Tax=Araneus ventricosus TaxID=182803 RepID=A0A4Y2TDH6_ARAVE|nr:hypothetical protein AVEN_223550-1 [Araneus ventricosus]
MLYYNLDPCHFITAADLTWNAGLNFTKAELELFTDVNMYLWIEDNIRGGICYVGKRYSCCNNRFVPETFDSKLEETYIIAVDANNLYGYTMTQSLPIGNFKFLSESEIKDFNVLELSAKDEVGYFLEVDLLYPSELHDLHDFPLAPDHTGYPKRLTGSSSQKRTIKVPKEPKHKECLGRYQDQYIYVGEEMNDDQDMSSEEFVPHVESSIQIVKKTVSRTSFSGQKKKISPKRIKGSVSRKLPADVRKESKRKDCFKNHRDKDNYSRGIKENGKIVEKFPSHSGSRIQTLSKKTSPSKLPDVKRKSLKEYREEDVDEFSESDEIDFEEHKNHPKDHATSFKDGYEKVSSSIL